MELLGFLPGPPATVLSQALDDQANIGKSADTGIRVPEPETVWVFTHQQPGAFNQFRRRRCRHDGILHHLLFGQPGHLANSKNSRHVSQGDTSMRRTVYSEQPFVAPLPPRAMGEMTPRRDESRGPFRFLPS